MIKKKIDWRIIAVGLIALGAIEVTALICGEDGKLLSAIVGIIALVIGVNIPNPLQTK